MSAVSTQLGALLHTIPLIVSAANTSPRVGESVTVFAGGDHVWAASDILKRVTATEGELSAWNSFAWTRGVRYATPGIYPITLDGQVIANVRVLPAKPVGITLRASSQADFDSLIGLLKLGDTLALAPGEYRTTRTTRIADGITIDGGGLATIRHIANPAEANTGYAIFTKASDLTLRGLRIIGFTTPNGNPPYIMYGGQIGRLTLDDCHLEEVQAYGDNSFFRRITMRNATIAPGTASTVVGVSVLGTDRIGLGIIPQGVGVYGRGLTFTDCFGSFFAQTNPLSLSLFHELRMGGMVRGGNRSENILFEDANIDRVCVSKVRVTGSNGPIISVFMNHGHKVRGLVVSDVMHTGGAQIGLHVLGNNTSGVTGVRAHDWQLQRCGPGVVVKGGASGIVVNRWSLIDCGAPLLGHTDDWDELQAVSFTPANRFLFDAEKASPTNVISSVRVYGGNGENIQRNFVQK